jgi:hypothetical protein
MATVIRVFSRAFHATNAESDSALPVLMFTVVGLLLSICLVLAFGALPFVELETF